MYIVSKCLYVAVPIFLLFSLSWMMGEKTSLRFSNVAYMSLYHTQCSTNVYCLGEGYGDYGLRALNGLIRDDGEYIENPMFPRVTLCDFTVSRRAVVFLSVSQMNFPYPLLTYPPH